MEIDVWPSDLRKGAHSIENPFFSMKQHLLPASHSAIAMWCFCLLKWTAYTRKPPVVFKKYAIALKATPVRLIDDATSVVVLSFLKLIIPTISSHDIFALS